MIIRIEDIQKSCTTILAAVDPSARGNLSTVDVADTLELKTVDNYLYMSVTNREYYVQVKVDLREKIEFHAAVNASKFLKLISQITTDTVEFNVDETSLTIKGNGKYKLPLIFNGEEMLELPKIVIGNPTMNFKISQDTLLSVLNYNGKELMKSNAVVKPVQKLYYVDEMGAITFTNGACVNNFTLPQPVKMLWNTKLVKLFKLFKERDIDFTLGYDAAPGSTEIIQTKVRFAAGDVEITAILGCDDSLINTVPVKAIRGRATADYPYSINVHKDTFVQAINRLDIFNKDAARPCSLFEFGPNEVSFYDVDKNSKEVLHYSNDNSGITETYSAYIDLNDLKTTLENCTEPYVVVSFGDGMAVVVKRGNITNIIPESTL